ncbi:tripartite tricarboxylate transporter TctB family protein [Acuticoccus kandeliae]|uniref:tripartite tricarboxylate transporter TctB family protein n=1 Tax=Acuticoccus kandeliae TaxID=2073160 RepID=UPI000D3E1D93|nr:tripartite tricarboxylate transporter TctB family protein [Acuticoccus kandeliae]
MSDRILGGISVAIAVFFIYSATHLPLPFMQDPVGNKTFPIIICVLMGISGIYFLLRPDPDPEWPELARIAEIGAATAVLVAYALLLPEVGFVLATWGASTYLSWRLGAHPVAAVIAGVLIAVGIYVIFRMVLGLSLAKGPWGF